MQGGWSLGSAKPAHARRIFHCFPEAINISLCKRVTRDSTHEVRDSVDFGDRCSKCDERANNRKPAKPAARRCANP